MKEVEQHLKANGAIISLKNPSYKLLMHEKFKQLGTKASSAEITRAVDEALQTLKERGGKFYHSSREIPPHYTQITEEDALASKCMYMCLTISYMQSPSLTLLSGGCQLGRNEISH